MTSASPLFQKLQAAKIAIAGISQQKRYILMTASVVCFLGWFAASMLPNKYESSAKVLADTRSMLEPLLRGIAVQNDTEQGVQIVAQTLLSRENLERIALKADLDIDSGTPEKYERLIENLKNEISITGSSKSNVYTVRYSHTSPETAKKVVELTLKQFLDTVTRQNKLDSNTATDFLVAQIEERKNSLEQAELTLARFKQENQGVLPQQGGGYYAMLSTISVQIDDIDNNISSKQAELDSLRSTFLPQTDVGGSPIVETTFDFRIKSLQQALDAELLNYTENHPRVKELRQQISAFEQQRSDAQSDIIKKASRGEMTSSGRDDDALQSFALQITRLESEISVLRNKRGSAQLRLDELKKKIQIIPAIEARLTSLQRDYEGSKRLYDELVKRLEQARLSQSANDNTSDVKFQTLEPPRAPITPSGPPRIVLYIFIFIASIAAGVAIALAKSKLRGRVVNIDHLSIIVGDENIIGQLLHQNHVKIIKKNRWRFTVFMMWFAAITMILLTLIVFEIKYGQPPGLLLKSFILK